MREWPWKRVLAGAATILLVAAAYLALRRAGLVDRLTEQDGVERMVRDLGALGPALIVTAMAVAIVVSPIPSAPIALASGAAYGDIWGTLYVAAGAEAGALVAFGIARFVGGPGLRAWLAGHPTTAFLHRFMRSQNVLMAVVFASRLLPFLSFDVVSYAAGATPLKAWRFAVATLLGILPASFLLAHFGEQLSSGDARRVGLTVLALGMLTLLPLAWQALPEGRKAAIRQRLGLA